MKFENVKIKFKNDEEIELERGFYDFHIKDGVICVLCFAAQDSSDIVASKIINPSEIKLIELY